MIREYFVCGDLKKKIFRDIFSLLRDAIFKRPNSLADVMFDEFVSLTVIGQQTQLFDDVI